VSEPAALVEFERHDGVHNLIRPVERAPIDSSKLRKDIEVIRQERLTAEPI
jgi:hypothetical protein